MSDSGCRSTTKRTPIGDRCTIVVVRSFRLSPGAPIAPQVVAASRRRAVLSCLNDGGDRATVPADAIREVCLDAGKLDPFGIRIEGARIEGVLDLRAVSLGVPLHFTGCRFGRCCGWTAQSCRVW
jgi:hypothetical protein